MARIFICWELGGSLGHLARLPIIVSGLVERGHELFLAAGKQRHLRDFPFPQSMVVLPVPTGSCPEYKAAKRICNATILLSQGYADIPTLEGMVRCWRGLYTLVQPDVLLFDYAPTAMLAARDVPAPKLILSSGFGSLVPGHPDTDLTPWVEGSRDEFQRQGALVTDHVNEVCRTYGLTPVEHFSEIYQCDFSLMSIIPELDEYNRDPSKTLYYTLFADLGFAAAEWSGNGSARIFAYLKPDFALTGLVLDVLAHGDYDVICYCPGIPLERAERYRAGRLQIVTKPVSLASVLPDADVVVCHASKGLVVESLLCGVPLLNLPTHIEQVQNGMMVEKLGAGLTVPLKSGAETISSRLEELLLDPSYRQVAGLIGSRNLPSANEETLASLVDRIESFIHAG